MSKKAFIFLFILIFLVFDSCLILAPGIGGPIFEKIFFEPGLEKTYEYVVHSNTDRTMDHQIGMTGDLAQYFTLSTTVLEDIPPDGYASFTATMKLPQELEPGEHSCTICVVEAETRGAGGAGASIGTRAAVCTQIIVFSPYVGKHADFTFSVNNVSKGDDAVFKLGVTNMGTETIDVNGIIEVFSQNVSAGKETKIITLKTQEKRGLTTGEYTELNATLNTSDMDTGEYRAKATLYYNSLQKTKEKYFRIGELDVEIIKFTEQVAQNKLNPINIKVKSNWNGKIKGIYASFEVIDIEKNIVIATINTPPTDLEPWETKNLVAYWDTTGVDVGEYKAKVTLYYEDKTTIKEGKIKVKEFITAPTISVTAILLFILIIVILVLIILIIQVMKKTQKRAKLKRKRKIKK